MLEDRDGEDEEEEALVRDFDCDGAQGAKDLLGFDKDGLEDDAKEDEWNLVDDGKSADPYFSCFPCSLGLGSLQEIPNRHLCCCRCPLGGKTLQGWC